MSPREGSNLPHQLGDPGAVISRDISRIAIVIRPITGLITPVIATHEPPRSTCVSFYPPALSLTPDAGASGFKE